MTESTNQAHYELIQAAQWFMFNVLPVREPQSRDALVEFIAKVQQIKRPRIEIDAVLIRCLQILDQHSGPQFPTLVDLYVTKFASSSNLWARFSDCVEELLKYSGISDRRVQTAIYIVNSRYTESDLTPRAIANVLGLRLSSLCTSFQAATHRTLRNYIREVRLNQAVVRLATTNLSIKEIWASLGYNHASTFDHDFGKRFGCSPREYRTRIIRPAAQQTATRTEHVGKRTTDCLHDQTNVLIIDDNDGVRRLLGSYLQVQGYGVTAAKTGVAGLHFVDQTSPHVVLVDYHLDDMDGFEFVRRLRRNARGNDCAVAIFTADWNLAQELDQLDALDVILASKLCALDSVRDLVLHLMRREQGLATGDASAFHTQGWNVL